MSERVEPPYAADERTMLVAYLDYYRETMIMKLDGLTEEQARTTPTPNANSLLGLVSHLANVERWWFHECFAGQPEAEQSWGDPDDPDWDFKPPTDRTIAELVDWYRFECARANDITSAAGLDEIAKHPRGAQRGVTMRWILVHMIEETARHAGHADITRELIDGAVGS